MLNFWLSTARYCATSTISEFLAVLCATNGIRPQSCGRNFCPSKPDAVAPPLLGATFGDVNIDVNFPVSAPCFAETPSSPSSVSPLKAMVLFMKSFNCSSVGDPVTRGFWTSALMRPGVTPFPDFPSRDAWNDDASCHVTFDGTFAGCFLCRSWICCSGARGSPAPFVAAPFAAVSSSSKRASVCRCWSPSLLAPPSGGGRWPGA